jgi:ATP-binding cassette subfamily B protein
MIEPGRSLVGNAGVCLTEVLYLKPGENKNFCIVDAAMNDLPRPAMYEAYHQIVPVALRAGTASNWDVVGPVCESGDWLGRDRSLELQPGDLLAVLSAGAYCMSMSSNYNTRGRPAEVLVDGDQAHLIRRRESPAVLRRLVDHGFASDASADQVALSFLYLFGLASALAVFSAGRYFTVSWLGERITADLRNAVYAHVLRQSPAFFETTQPGEVLSRLGNDTTLVQTVLSSSFSMGLRNLLMGTGALVMLIWTNPWLMLQVVTVLVAVILPSVYLGRRVRRLSRASQDRMADSSALASEVLHAIPVVQSHTAEARETSRFVEASRRSLRTALGRIRARSLLISFIIVASSAVLLWGLYRGTLAVHAGTSTAGQLGETVLYVMLLSSAFAVLGEVYGDLARAAGATERLMELLGSESSIQTVAQPVQPAWPSEGSTLQLEGVRFHYPSRPQSWAVDGLSATVSAGQTVAVVGPSGAGKTTLFDLLLRLYDPQSGRIVLDGAPIDQMSLQDLRARIAIVPQEPVIFSGTVSENIRYSRPEASMEEVKSAARAAYADRFITAAAHRHRARHSEGLAAAAARRSHKRARRPERADGSIGAGAGHGRADHPGDRPQARDGTAGRRDLGAGSRAPGRAGQPCRTAGARRPVRQSGGPAVRRLTLSRCWAARRPAPFLPAPSLSVCGSAPAPCAHRGSATERRRSRAQRCRVPPRFP